MFAAQISDGHLVSFVGTAAAMLAAGLTAMWRGLRDRLDHTSEAAASAAVAASRVEGKVDRLDGRLTDHMAEEERTAQREAEEAARWRKEVRDDVQAIHGRIDRIAGYEPRATSG